jgi:hypothetical protein
LKLVDSDDVDGAGFGGLFVGVAFVFADSLLVHVASLFAAEEYAFAIALRHLPPLWRGLHAVVTSDTFIP